MRYIQRFDSASTEQAAIDQNLLGKPYIAFIEDGQYIDWNTKTRNDTKIVAYYKSGATTAIMNASSADTFDSAELEDGTPVVLGEKLDKYFSQGGQVIKVYYTLKNENILGDSAFCFSTAQKVEIPNSVVMSGIEMFNHSSVSAVNVTTATTILPFKCFRSCDNLKEIVLHEGLQKTSEESLAYSGFLNITFPNSLTEIGKNTLWKSENLTWIEFKGTIPPTLMVQFSNPLGDPALTFPIYVPDEAVAAYKAAPTWSIYANRVKGISEKPQ